MELPLTAPYLAVIELDIRNAIHPHRYTAGIKHADAPEGVVRLDRRVPSIALFLGSRGA